MISPNAFLLSNYLVRRLSWEYVQRGHRRQFNRCHCGAAPLELKGEEPRCRADVEHALATHVVGEAEVRKHGAIVIRAWRNKSARQFDGVIPEEGFDVRRQAQRLGVLTERIHLAVVFSDGLLREWIMIVRRRDEAEPIECATAAVRRRQTLKSSKYGRQSYSASQYHILLRG